MRLGRKRTSAEFNEKLIDHLNFLYDFAMILTRNPVDAEDLVQLVSFMRAL